MIQTIAQNFSQVFNCYSAEMTLIFQNDYANERVK